LECVWDIVLGLADPEINVGGGGIQFQCHIS